MLTHEFDYLYGRLVSAFPVAKAEERRKIYYEVLAPKLYDTFAEIVEKWVRTQRKFPMIADLLDEFRALEPQERIIKQDCDVCDGYGSVFIRGIAYRGDCQHGERLSKKIRVAPTDPGEVQREVETWDQEDLKIYGRLMRKRLPLSPGQKAPHWWKGPNGKAKGEKP